MPTVLAVVSVFELVFGLSLLAHASARGGIYVLLGVCFAAMAVTWSRPTVVDTRGVRAVGRLRRTAWANVAAIDRPNSHEGSLVIVLKNGRRVQTGFPADMLSRMATLQDDARRRLTGS